jgi:hypothetical protein
LALINKIAKIISLENFTMESRKSDTRENLIKKHKSTVENKSFPFFHRLDVPRIPIEIACLPRFYSRIFNLMNFSGKMNNNIFQFSYYPRKEKKIILE